MGLGLLLGTEVPVMMPDIADFSFLFSKRHVALSQLVCTMG